MLGNQLTKKNEVKTTQLLNNMALFEAKNQKSKVEIQQFDKNRTLNKTYTSLVKKK